MGTEMMRRVLPRDEWHKLAGTELETVAPHLPADARVLVVEDADGKIVGTWAFFMLVHAEGVWVDPAFRGRAVVGRNLIDGMKQIVRGMGAQAVVTASVSADVSNMLRRLGAAQIEGEHFSLRVGL